MNAYFQDNKKFYSTLKCTLNLLSKKIDLRLPARLCLAWQAGLRKSASH